MLNLTLNMLTTFFHICSVCPTKETLNMALCWRSRVDRNQTGSFLCANHTLCHHCSCLFFKGFQFRAHDRLKGIRKTNLC